ncbi:hypothetical protein TNCT_496631 [Trichonephila clavata]|uniref:Uncharacterized protein n=1 Tax=Trichonephila clavata TaxID=2740835 RepID=A0A8X6G391_TRICU|nr:hypothetical protein TNCT_496631 [Trichonephila clavata]
MKMARLNNPSTQKNTLYFEGADDIRKSNNLEKRFFKQMTKKSNVTENYTRVSNQSWRLPALHTGNITAHPLLPQGCHGAVCSIL